MCATVSTYTKPHPSFRIPRFCEVLPLVVGMTHDADFLVCLSPNAKCILAADPRGTTMALLLGPDKAASFAQVKATPTSPFGLDARFDLDTCCYEHITAKVNRRYHVEQLLMLLSVAVMAGSPAAWAVDAPLWLYPSFSWLGLLFPALALLSRLPRFLRFRIR